jgi:hypothetical protein
MHSATPIVSGLVLQKYPIENADFVPSEKEAAAPLTQIKSV